MLRATVLVAGAHRHAARHAVHALPEHVALGALAKLLDDRPPGVRRHRTRQQRPVLVGELAEADAEGAEARRGGRDDHAPKPDAVGDEAGQQRPRPTEHGERGVRGLPATPAEHERDLRREPVGEGLDHRRRPGARALKAERLGDALFDRLGGELRTQRDGAGREPLRIEIAGDQRRVRQRRPRCRRGRSTPDPGSAPALSGPMRIFSALDPEQRAAAERGGAQLGKRERQRQSVHRPEEIERRAIAVDHTDVGARAPDVERHQLALAGNAGKSRRARQAAHRARVERLDRGRLGDAAASAVVAHDPQRLGDVTVPHPRFGVVQEPRHLAVQEAIEDRGRGAPRVVRVGADLARIEHGHGAEQMSGEKLHVAALEVALGARPPRLGQGHDDPLRAAREQLADRGQNAVVDRRAPVPRRRRSRRPGRRPAHRRGSCSCDAARRGRPFPPDRR